MLLSLQVLPGYYIHLRTLQSPITSCHGFVADVSVTVIVVVTVIVPVAGPVPLELVLVLEPPEVLELSEENAESTGRGNGSCFGVFCPRCGMCCLSSCCGCWVYK